MRSGVDSTGDPAGGGIRSAKAGGSLLASCTVKTNRKEGDKASVSVSRTSRKQR